MEALKPHISFIWDTSRTDKTLSINESTSEINCSSSIGPHKNAVGDIALYPGNVSYWEVKVGAGNYIKVGVSKNKNVKAKGSFADDENGWAYFSKGQTRHNSNIEGTEYGKAFGSGDVVGVFLDQMKGTLSFYLNDELLGVAFEDDELANSVLYPAVSCLMEGESFGLTSGDRDD